MEMRNVPLRSIKVDPLAHELATSDSLTVSAPAIAKSQRINRTACRQTMQKPHDLHGQFNLGNPSYKAAIKVD
jgi:hypothetical protein